MAPPPAPDLAKAKVHHKRVLQRADYVLAEAFRKADSAMRTLPYTGPERRQTPR